MVIGVIRVTKVIEGYKENKDHKAHPVRYTKWGKNTIS